MAPTPATGAFAGRRLHLIGIGGAGMSGLAVVARALGAELTGSDRAETPFLARVRAAGIEPSIGHSADAVPAGAEVVHSTAIDSDNVELAAARAAGARVLHRGDLLAEIAALKRAIVVAGAHGKTTTASMVAHALIGCGADPAYVIGGELRSTGANAEWGSGEWIVVEGDESDRSFLSLRPEVAVVTNVELDHHATWRSLADLRAAFAEFARGAAVRVAWAPEAGALGLDERVVRFGIGEGDVAAEEVRLEAGGSRFAAAGAEVELHVPGRHNVLNALAAIAACEAAGVEPAAAAEALRTFAGAGRRLERHCTTATGSVVYDDYAHHPTEVTATLEAAGTLGARRIVACFQPHLYSRTRHLAREFGRALAQADVVCVLDVYAARERAEDHPGVSGWMVAAAAADAAGGRPVYWTPGLDDAERLLREELREGDLLITLGAGDVDSVARRLCGEAPGPHAAAGAGVA